MTVIEPKLTVDDLALLPDDGKRYELIEGELLVTGILSIAHQLICSNLVFELGFYLRQRRCGNCVMAPGVIFDSLNSVIPDLVYVSHERRAHIEHGGRLHGAPELIIEILSPGGDNRRRDEVIKRQTYAKFGVEEYWIVDPEQRAIAPFRLRNGVLQPSALVRDNASATTPLLPGFALVMHSVFVE